MSDFMGDREGALVFIHANLESTGIPSDLAKLVAQEVVSEFKVDARGMLVSSLGWAIADDDLQVVAALSDGARYAATAGILGGGMADSRALLSAVAGLVGISLRVVRQILTKSADKLTVEQLCILQALRTSKHGMSIEDLRRWPKFQKSTPDAMREHLDRLKAVRLRDGNVKAFVAQDGNGLWKSVGV